MASLESVTSELTALRNEVKALTKLVRKIRSHQEDPDGEKANERSKKNGFNRDVEVDGELRAFLGLDEGQLISRSEVTKRVNIYVKENNLKHPDNGRVIILDDKLKALLSPPEDVQVTFLNLQKYLSPHYVKAAPAPAPAPAPETPPSTPEAGSEAKPAKKVVRRPVVKKTAVVA